MFADRAQAGALLAERVRELDLNDPVVLALPRGGVPVAVPVALALNAPLDLLMVRKIGLPGSPEVAAGAVVDGPAHEAVFNSHVLRTAGLKESDLQEQVSRKLQEIEERREKYVGSRRPPMITGRSVVIVDDGIATGATVKAALKALWRRGPSKTVLAVPVAPPDVLRELAPLVDEIVCLSVPTPFFAVGAHYRDFAQVGDDEVVAGLNEANAHLIQEDT